MACELRSKRRSALVYSLDHVDEGVPQDDGLIAWPTTDAVHAATRVPFESIDQGAAWFAGSASSTRSTWARASEIERGRIPHRLARLILVATATAFHSWPTGPGCLKSADSVASILRTAARNIDCGEILQHNFDSWSPIGFSSYSEHSPLEFCNSINAGQSHGRFGL